MRKLLALLVFVVGPLLYLVRRRVPPRERVHLYYDDGSMVTLEPSAPEAERLLTLARAALQAMGETDELGEQLRRHALLEGDFLLRSGKRSSYYLDKYRFETLPELLGPIGERLAAAVREYEPAAVRLAGPALGAVALAAAASLSSGLPFVIVRDAAKQYGTANRLEGVFEEGELVCLIEDVVTSGGALAEAVGALRAAGLVVRNAVCVVDREEGGADALARLGVRLRSLYRAGELVPAAKTAANRMVEP